MAWHARLSLDYASERGRTVARFEHEGPLRVLQPLYPEGDTICHNVLVHPPGGLVGGDTLDVSVRVRAGAHGLVTTPGATRFYRSLELPASQRTAISVEAGARFEWLPLEAICHAGCRAENRLEVRLAGGAELVAWDVTALGLPASQQPFDRGRVLQHFEVHGAWLERGSIDAADARLMDGPLGLAGRRCMATLFFAASTAIERTRRERALDVAREAIATHADVQAGATAPAPRVLAVRVLSAQVEPAMLLLKAVRDAWRSALWDLAPTRPRTWAL